MHRRPITTKQKEVLVYIEQQIMLHGHAPTAAEVAFYFNISLRPAQKHIDSLYVKGYIKKIPGVARGIVVLP